MFSLAPEVFAGFLLILGLGTLILLKCFSKKVAILVATFKALIFVLFYSLIYDGYSIYRDSFVYRQESLRYFKHFKHPFEFFFDISSFNSNFRILRKIAEGIHFMYGWLNHLMDYLIGINDASPAALNIVLTFITAAFLYEILIRSQIQKSIAKLCALFYLLHWDTITWSTVFNLKEIFLNFCVTYLLYIYVRLQDERSAVLYLNALLALFFLFFTRFYLFPFIFTALLLNHLRWEKKFLKKACVAFLISLLPITLLFTIFSLDTLIRVSGNLNFNFMTPVYFIRFFLTPIPINLPINATYEFLSASLNLISFPLLLFGLYRIYIDKPQLRFLIYLLVILGVFYAGFPPSSIGSRHRIQVSSSIILCQFYALYIIYLKLISVRVKHDQVD